MPTHTKQTTIIVDPALKAQLRERASETGENVKDIIVCAAAEALGVKYEPSGRGQSWNAGSDSDTLHLRMPENLHRKIRQEALRVGVSMGALLRSYALEYLARPIAA